MPQPVELDELQEPLLGAYRRAWDRVQAEQQSLATDPLRYRRRLRLVEMQRAIAADMARLDEQAAEWIGRRLPHAYSLGVQQASAAGASPLWSMIHQEAVEELAISLFQDLLAATKNVNDSTKKLVRDVAKDEALQSALQGRTARQAARLMEQRLSKSGIHAITYSNGAKHGLAEYTQVAIRTKTATAYNYGTLNAHSDVQFFEVFDGPACGWTTHNDPQPALGRVVSRDEAQAYPISHPNCRRAFGPRPDVTTKAEAKGASPTVKPEQTEAQRAADAAGGRRRPAKAQPKPKPKLPASKAETPMQAARRAREEMLDIRAGRLLDSPTTHPPGHDDLMPPLEAAVTKVADVPTVGDLINKGYSPADAIVEQKRLLKNARNVERRARKKSGGATDVLTDQEALDHAIDVTKKADLDQGQIDALEGYTQGSATTNTILRSGDEPTGLYKKRVDRLDAALEKSKTGQPMRLYRSVDVDVVGDLKVGSVITDRAYLSTTTSESFAKKYGGASDSVVLEFDLPAGQRALAPDAFEVGGESEVLLGRNTSLRVVSEQIRGGRRFVKVEVVGAPKPKVKTAKQLIVEADQAQKPKLGQLHLEPAALHSEFGGPGGPDRGAWHDRMTADRVDYIPVVDLRIPGDYYVANGIATRRKGISYLMEVPDGTPVTDAMRAEFEAHILKIQTVLADVPTGAVQYQKGFAILQGKNPADAYWEKQYNIPGFTSAATGGNGATNFWGAQNVSPGTIVHELGHNLDSGHSAAKPGLWLSDGAIKEANTGAEWADFQKADAQITKGRLFAELDKGVLVGSKFVETRPGSHPITLGTEGSTTYGAASKHEDFAESFRLYVKDRREGKLGYMKPEPGQSLGTNIRFADLYPARAEYFDKVLGIQTEFNTAWRQQQLAKFDNDWSPAAGDDLVKHQELLDRLLQSPGIIARDYGLPTDVVIVRLNLLVQRAKEAAEELKKAAEAAARAAAAAKPLTAADLSFGDKTGIGVKAGNAKKAALKKGASAAEAEAIFKAEKARLIQARLDDLNAQRGIASGKVDVTPPADGMSPVSSVKEDPKALAFLNNAGKDVHPRAAKQDSKQTQAKANIAAEIGSRLNNREDWEKFVAAQKAVVGVTGDTWSMENGLRKLLGPGDVVPDFDNIPEDVRQRILDSWSSQRVQTWAATSGDSDKAALAMQQAIKEEFGVTGDPFAGAGQISASTRLNYETYYKAYAPAMRRFAREMYNHTQREMAAAGITHVEVWRGMNLPKDLEWGKVGQRRPKLMPANSWSTRFRTSANFGRTMFRARIPASRVLGSSRTGFGCYNEQEYVIFDTDGAAEVKDQSAWNGLGAS